jgi:hypothetical protein
MSEAPPSTIRSVGAIVAGLVFIVASHTGTDAILHATHIFPPVGKAMSDALFVLAFSYRAVFSIIGCFITALLAPRRPMKHALILGSIGVILSTVGAIATWNAGPELGPRWYPISLALSALPAAWIGGLIRKTQLKAPALPQA